MPRRRYLALAGAATLVAALALVQAGAAGPGSLGALFFGPKLVRAEVILDEGGTLRDYRVDRGSLTAIARRSATLLERDGTTVTVPLRANADIRLGGKTVRVARLRVLLARGRSLVATTVRLGDKPAHLVRVERS